MKNLFTCIIFLFCININAQTVTEKVDSVKSINGFLLEKSSQNPYGATSFITFNLPVDANVKIFVQYTSNDKFPCLKDTVCIIYDGYLSNGYYKSTWDLKNNINNTVENGFYDFHLIAETNENGIYKMSFKGKTRIVVLR